MIFSTTTEEKKCHFLNKIVQMISFFPSLFSVVCQFSQFSEEFLKRRN